MPVTRTAHCFCSHVVELASCTFKFASVCTITEVIFLAFQARIYTGFFMTWPSSTRSDKATGDFLFAFYSLRFARSITDDGRLTICEWLSGDSWWTIWDSGWRSTICNGWFEISDLRFAIRDSRLKIGNLQFAICCWRFVVDELRFQGWGKYWTLDLRQLRNSSTTTG